MLLANFLNMSPRQLRPLQALNKAFLKVKPARADIERLRHQLHTLLEHANDTGSGEHHKDLLSEAALCQPDPLLWLFQDRWQL